MDLYILLATVGVLGVVVASLSARLRLLPLSEPLLALVAGIALGPQVLGLLPLPPLTEAHSTLHHAAEVLLAVSVMGVALRYPFHDARRLWRPVLLLLLVAMPAMALVVTGLAWWVLGLGWGAALLLGTALCPTDPVLASSVVTGEPAERDIPERDRQLLSLESGANDGLAVAFVLVAVAVAGPLGAGAATWQIVQQVVGGIVLGAVAGWLGGRALRAGDEHGATSHGPMLLFTLVLALLVLGLSGALHLNGVLGAFVAGLAFNLTSTGGERRSEVEIDEAVNRFAVLPVFVLFGATIPWAAVGDLGWAAAALVVAVLLLRRLPVLLLLRRPLRLGWADALYLGWFGPIGVSAVFYLTLQADEMRLPPAVMGAGVLLVLVSTVAHGVTSAPGRTAYRRLAGSERP